MGIRSQLGAEAVAVFSLDLDVVDRPGKPSVPSVPPVVEIVTKGDGGKVVGFLEGAIVSSFLLGAWVVGFFVGLFVTVGGSVGCAVGLSEIQGALRTLPLFTFLHMGLQFGSQ